MSKYLKFIVIEQRPKTKVIGVMCKTYPIRLGIIKWWSSWQQYAFFPETGTIFNVECLNDIQSHIREL